MPTAPSDEAADVAAPAVHDDDAPPPWDEPEPEAAHAPAAAQETGPAAAPEPAAGVDVAPEPAAPAAPEPAPAPVVEPTPEPVHEPAAPVAEPVVVPAAEPAAAPAPAPVPEPVVAAVAEPMPEPAAPAAEENRAPATGAGEDSETLRRRWDEVLATLSDLKKATWVLVKDNSRVAELTPTTLRLAFTAPGLVSAFRNGPHSALVQQAVKETLGYDVRVEGEVQGDSPAPATRPQAASVAAPVTRAHAPVDDVPARHDDARAPRSQGHGGNDHGQANHAPQDLPEPPADPDPYGDGDPFDGPRQGDGHAPVGEHPAAATSASVARHEPSPVAPSADPVRQPAATAPAQAAEPQVVDSWDVVPVGTWTRDEPAAPANPAPANPAPASPAPADVTWDVVPVGTSAVEPAATEAGPSPAPAADPWASVVERIVAEPQPRHEPAPAPVAARPAPSTTPSAPLTGAAAARAAALAGRAAAAAHPRTSSADEPPHDDAPPPDEPSYEDYEDSVPFTETTLMGVPLVVQILGATVLEETNDTED